MITEITDITDIERNHGWVLYDGDCGMCRGLETRWGPTLRRRGLDLAPLQTPWVRRRLGSAVTPDQMLLLLPDGRVLGGADALIALSARIWWAWPAFALAHLPGVRPLLRRAYAFVAARRHRFLQTHGACSVGSPPKRSPLAVLPLLAFVTTALLVRNRIPTWALMWLIASSMFYGCKWLTWQHNRRLAAAYPVTRTLAYFFAWPGMNPRAFFTPAKPLTASRGHPVLWPLTKIALGITLLWIVAPHLPAAWPLVRAWVGMAGIIFILHMGCFDLLAVAWRRRGIDARPVIDHPLQTTSVSDFWSNRWNIPFRDLAHTYIAKPLARHGRLTAMLAVFLISGLVHELLISVPAHGGYGLPTLYFTIQVPAVLVERRLRLTDLAARLWMFIFVAGLAPLGFHPIFVANVVLPFMHAIHAF